MYETFSLVYDTFMDDVDYGEWAEYLKSFIDTLEKDNIEILEYGCGTGSLTRELSRDFAIEGIDLSEEMLSQAERKGDAIRYRKGDLRIFSPGRKFDVIICGGDTLNYLTPEELKRFFRKAYDELKDEGLLLFDLVSTEFLRDCLGTETTAFELDDVYLIWRSEAAENSLNFFFTFFVREGNMYSRREEYQTEYFHDFKEVTKSLIETGFKVSGYDFLTHNDYSGIDRIQFSAKKCLT